MIYATVYLFRLTRVIESCCQSENNTLPLNSKFTIFAIVLKHSCQIYPLKLSNSVTKKIPQQFQQAWTN